MKKTCLAGAIVLALGFTGACGSDDDDGEASAAATTTTAALAVTTAPAPAVTAPPATAPPATAPPTTAARPTPANVEDVQYSGDAWGWSPIGYRGKNGTRLRFTCTPNGHPTNAVYGTGIYSDDTRACYAAVHAGLITFASGGTVYLEVLPGQASYQGSTANGVESRNSGAAHGSYRFL